MNFLEYGYSIEDYLTKHLGLELERGGRFVCCPIHNEDTPSCRVYTETDSFYCFGCNAGGDIVQLHRLVSKKQGKMLGFHATINELCGIVSEATNRKVEKNGFSSVGSKKMMIKDGNRVISRSLSEKSLSTGTVIQNDIGVFDKGVSEGADRASTGIAELDNFLLKKDNLSTGVSDEKIKSEGSEDVILQLNHLSTISAESSSEISKTEKQPLEQVNNVSVDTDRPLTVKERIELQRAAKQSGVADTADDIDNSKSISGADVLKIYADIKDNLRKGNGEGASKMLLQLEISTL